MSCRGGSVPPSLTENSPSITPSCAPRYADQLAELSGLGTQRPKICALSGRMSTMTASTSDTSPGTASNNPAKICAISAATSSCASDPSALTSANRCRLFRPARRIRAPPSIRAPSTQPMATSAEVSRPSQINVHSSSQGYKNIIQRT